MTSRFEKYSAFTGVAAVLLWILGVLVFAALPSSLSDKASDLQTLTWVQQNANDLLLGGWLFMLGSVCFLWFAGVLRARLVVAEGGSGTVSSIAFAGGIATAVFGIANPAPDLAAAINKDDISPATAGTLHHLSDAFFVSAELSLVVLLAAVAVLGFRTRVVPRWWAGFGVLLAVVLVIGPIGWAGLLFGFPLWTLGTTALLVRGPKGDRVAAVTAAGA